METPAAPWQDGSVTTDAGVVPRVRTTLELRDHLGTVAARWGVGRMDYRVAPGLYAVGNPSPTAPVLVSANYKMSFDRLRSVLAGRDAWLLVLDTRGVNVWCAAGKGTFGTDEIVRRVREVGLDRFVTHRSLVVPQLGAPGVSAHEVARACGYRVVYGPVRAEDLPAFLDAGAKKASPAMRRVPFGLAERAALVPMELVMGLKLALILSSLFLLLGGLGPDLYSWARVRAVGLPSAGLFFGTFALSAVLGPLLLPWLPGRAFSLKGATLGVALVVAVAAAWSSAWPFGVLHAAAWALLVPALASFVLMNFTGASTFTSLSGVLKEMRLAMPVQGGASLLGFGLWIAGLFVGGGAIT